jgi:hypothetical protein
MRRGNNSDDTKSNKRYIKALGIIARSIILRSCAHNSDLVIVHVYQ